MNTHQPVPDKSRKCPSCKHETTFRFAGEQEYPLSIALAAGFKTNMFSLWMCNTCHTSQLEPQEKPIMVVE